MQILRVECFLLAGTLCLSGALGGTAECRGKDLVERCADFEGTRLDDQTIVAAGFGEMESKAPHRLGSTFPL